MRGSGTHCCQRCGQRDELLDEVWGYNSYPTTRTVDNHIARLRQKIESNIDEPQHILTVHGVGYKFVA
jgi:two-component system response regulator VicR